MSTVEPLSESRDGGVILVKMQILVFTFNSRKYQQDAIFYLKAPLKLKVKGLLQNWMTGTQKNNT